MGETARHCFQHGKVPDTVALSGTRLVSLVSPELLYVRCSVWRRLQESYTTSEFQRDVSDRLSELGIDHVEEYVTEQGLFRIDIAFSGPENMRVAMEVDGPYHFTRNTRQPLGSTLLRQATAAPEPKALSEHNEKGMDRRPGCSSCGVELPTPWGESYRAWLSGQLLLFC